LDIDPDFKPIGTLTAGLGGDGGQQPVDYATAHFASSGEVGHPMGFSRADHELLKQWEASGLCYRGLLFEEVNLERHGYSIGVFQPMLSAAHFFGRVPALPYLAFAEKARMCRAPLGHYRPGSRSAYELYLPPLSARGGLAEAVTAVGLFYAIP
jgi:hypothetical protein